MDDHNNGYNYAESFQEANDEGKHLSILTEWLKMDTDSESSVEVDTRSMYSDYLAHFYHIANPDTLDKTIPKPQRERTCFSDNHLKVLEEYFKETSHPDTKSRTKLARSLDLPQKTIQIWFQNRRAKERRLKNNNTISIKNASFQYTAAPPGDGANNNTYILSSQVNQNFEKPLCNGQFSAVFIPPEVPKSGTSVVQVLDSSSNFSCYANTKECEIIKDDKDITMIHIPESDHSTLDSIAPIEVHDKLNQNMTENQMETLESFPAKEMQNIDSLNLDLLVRTYEMLLASNDANLLITNWLEKQKAEHSENLTLEANLKLFVNYCENVLPWKNY